MFLGLLQLAQLLFETADHVLGLDQLALALLHLLRHVAQFVFVLLLLSLGLFTCCDLQL